uniref:Secreted protein n=1 Tax=Zea mays TaxID=4577 RepID=B4FWH3_MAIZE|nr:unknown [Zea mays]
MLLARRWLLACSHAPSGSAALGDLAQRLCASTLGRRPPHLHKPTSSPSPLRHRPARLLCQRPDQPRRQAGPHR